MNQTLWEIQTAFLTYPNQNDSVERFNGKKYYLLLGEDCTSGCLLDYEYIKNCYRLIAVDLSWQKEFDVDPKAIEQIKFVGK